MPVVLGPEVWRAPEPKSFLADWSPPLIERVNACLLKRFESTWPSRFALACAYPMKTGGKRFRPLLSLAAADAIGVPLDETHVATASALELIHTYSLVHDDLPCMDDDDERRGSPTVHVVYDEAPALLVGDALLTEAFALLSELPLEPQIVVALVSELATAAGHRGMVGGQAGDIGMAGEVKDLDSLVRVHGGKTGALICAAVRMGAIAAGADEGSMTAVTTYGRDIGLAFQMADDLLDAEEDAGADGPPSYVKLLGERETRNRAQTLLNNALKAIACLPRPEALSALARFAIERSH